MLPHLPLLLPLLLLGACTLTFDTDEYPYFARSRDQGLVDAGATLDMPPARADMTSRDMPPGPRDMPLPDMPLPDMPLPDMPPPPFSPKVVVSEIMIDPDDNATEEWVEIANVTSQAIPLNRLLFVTWGPADGDLNRAPVGTRQNFISLVLGNVPQTGQPATVASLPPTEHLVILKSTATGLDEKIQGKSYLWLATDKTSDPSFQLTNVPGSDEFRSVALYYLEEGGQWRYQSSLSWKRAGLFSLSPTPNVEDEATLKIQKRRSWSLAPQAYPLEQNLPLDLGDWCMDDSDDLGLEGSKGGGGLRGSPGFEATACAKDPS